MRSHVEPAKAFEARIQRRLRRLRRDIDAVSDLIGNILLIGVTVVMVAGLGAVLATQPGPVERTHTTLTTSIAQGSGDWGTGDEQIRIEHRGGEPMIAAETTIKYRVNGVLTEVSGAALGGAFADGRLTIGETWIRTDTIPAAAPVGVDVVSTEASGSALVSTNQLAATCGADTTAPTAQSWTQAPVDVKTSTTGVVSVTVVAADACAGVSQALPPTLYYRLNDGSNPVYTNGGVMTLTGVSTWQKNIPDLTWASQATKTLQYYVSPLTDLNGNAGASTTQSDVVQADCASDTSAPTVQTWTQTPNDVTASTSGAITIVALLTDACAGVDNNANPELHHRINDGSNPAFTNAGAMTRTATNQWQGTIPDPTWASQSGKTLEYELRLMKDLNANSGTSTRQSDLIQSSCASDVTPPTVQTWLQNPADVATSTVGTVTITATLTDACAGVDTTANPELHYRLNDGTSPAFTNGGAMSRTSGTTWTKAIPDLGWGTQGTKTLEYELRLMKDLNANSGTSTRQSDVVQVVTVYTPVNSNVATTGTVSNFGNAQSAADTDAVATILEGSSAGSPLTNQYTATGVTSASTWSTSTNAIGTPDQYATNTNRDDVLELGFADQVGTPGTITTVVLFAEQSISPFVDDGWTLQACIGATCSLVSGIITGSAADTLIQYDVSCKRPGSTDGVCNLWTWTDINGLSAKIIGKRVSGGTNDGTWRIDVARVDVTYTPPGTYSTDVQFNWAGVPSGATQVLELRYRTTVDTFNVQVWDGAAYRTCTGALNAVSLTTYTCALTLPAEYQSGSPRIRFTDVTPSGASQGSLFIEYARVKTN